MFLVVISLVLMVALLFLYTSTKEKSDMNTKLASLNESVLKLEEDNTKLRNELEHYNKEYAEMETDLNRIVEEKQKMEETLRKIQEEKTAVEKSLLDEQEKKELFVYRNLVRVKDIDASVVVELKYATEDNFTQKRVYPSDAKALLRLETALKLKKANERFEQDGYRIKIWDAYRPKSVQEIFWSLVPDPKYVADPSKPSGHNIGTSVDITLIDSDGKELLMPTGYDDFSEKASRNYTGSDATAMKNMKYMEKIMTESGFRGLHSEWWHFDDLSGNYSPPDVDFSVFN